MEYGKKIQIHNFVLVKHKIDKTSFIKVSSLAGDWSVSYREDNIMFVSIDASTEENNEALYNIFTAMYGVCNIIDSDFTKEVFDSMHRYFDKLKAEKPNVSEEEDSKILEEERRMYELNEEIKKGE